MVVSELYSAGCPDGDRLNENISEEDAQKRILNALPYIRHIKNTSCYWGVKIIMKDLYGWDKDINEQNWRDADAAIKEKSRDASWPREIMKKGGVEKTNTELCKRHGGIADDMFFYNLEWAFFTRCQWKQYDTALLELEVAWSQEGVGGPLPVNIDPALLNIKKRIKSIDDVNEAVDYYISKIPFDEIHSLPSHYSTDIEYREVSGMEMAAALKKRDKAGRLERDVYANYIFNIFLQKLNRLGRKVKLSFSLGAEPLKYETGSKLNGKTLFSLADTARKYENLDFIVYSGCEYQEQALCTLIRETPNLYAAGFWWHNYFPETIARIISLRLDMLPLNKWFGFYSDAYCLDWQYAKSRIVRKQYAWELAHKISQGRYGSAEALDTVKTLIYDTPVAYFGL
jgi:glucuronate isomerase